MKSFVGEVVKASMKTLTLFWRLSILKIKSVSRRSLMLEREHGAPFCEEYRIVRPDGSIKWVLARSFFIGKDGQELRIAGIVEDITERKAAEQALRESEEKFRLVTETIEDVFWISTPGAKEIIYVSPAYEKIWGRSVQSVYQFPESFIEAIHPDDREQVLNGMREQARGSEL